MNTTRYSFSSAGFSLGKRSGQRRTLSVILQSPFPAPCLFAATGSVLGLLLFFLTELPIDTAALLPATVTIPAFLILAFSYTTLLLIRVFGKWYGCASLLLHCAASTYASSLLLYEFGVPGIVLCLWFFFPRILIHCHSIFSPADVRSISPVRLHILLMLAVLFVQCFLYPYLLAPLFA